MFTLYFLLMWCASTSAKRLELQHPAAFYGSLIGQSRARVYVALLCPRTLSRALSRQEDGVCQDAVVCVVTFTSQRFLQRRLLFVLSHRRDREEMFHRGDPGRDDDYRWVSAAAGSLRLMLTASSPTLAQLANRLTELKLAQLADEVHEQICWFTAQ